MTNDVQNNSTSSRELSSSELDLVQGGMSQFIAVCVATIRNAMDPSAQCVAADRHVVCQH